MTLETLDPKLWHFLQLRTTTPTLTVTIQERLIWDSCRNSHNVFFFQIWYFLFFIFLSFVFCANLGVRSVGVNLVRVLQLWSWDILTNRGSAKLRHRKKLRLASISSKHDHDQRCFTNYWPFFFFIKHLKSKLFCLIMLMMKIMQKSCKKI